MKKKKIDKEEELFQELGHKDIKMTLRYAHLAPAHKLKAVNVLDDTLNNRRTVQKVRNQASGGVF